MLYAAKCYWPGVTEADLEQVAERAARGDIRSRDEGVAYLGSLLFSAEDLVLCLFEGPSRTAVKHASERAGIPCERPMDSVWLQPDQRTRARGVTMRLSAVGRVLRRAKRWVSRALQLLHVRPQRQRQQSGPGRLVRGVAHPRRPAGAGLPANRLARCSALLGSIRR
jgi:hypothetical protein